MTHSLNSLKGGYIGDYIGVVTGVIKEFFGIRNCSFALLITLSVGTGQKRTSLQYIFPTPLSHVVPLYIRGCFAVGWGVGGRKLSV